MESVGRFLKMIPTTIWVIIALMTLVGVFWFSDDVGSAWEGRKQAKFDAKQVQYEKDIDALKKSEAELIKKAEVAEAREQAKTIEADLLRQEAAKRGVNIEQAQKVIDSALSRYEEDATFRDKVATGEVSKLQLCEKQCADSAEQGYPCRANYCSTFKE